MSDAAATTETAIETEAFDDLDRALAGSGPAAAIELLIRRLDERGEHRALLDALLLKARHDLELPPVQLGSFADLPEPQRKAFEERYVAAIRVVGGKLLDAGDIPGAWPYFRAIGETEPVARALDAIEPAEDDERLGPLIDVAFNQGAHPRKGFELILRHYGTCSAISAFEHLPRDDSTRTACADRLVRQLHEHLVANLRADIAQRGQPMPPEGAPIPALIAGRDWLFADDAYHIDVSHLASTVRVSPLLGDPATIALAAELADYGRRLSERHKYEGDPPFEDVYEDHHIYLNALLGQEIDAAVAHFRGKLSPPARDPDGEESEPARDDPLAAQVLVNLLVRLGRLDEAIGVASEHLAGLPESALLCPSVAQLCQRAGRPSRLAEIARRQGDLVNYTAAILQTGAAPGRRSRMTGRTKDDPRTDPRPFMPNPRPLPEAREVDRIEALATVDDAARADEFLDRCIPGSEWTVRVRTAEVSATLISRQPLGTFDERVCTCMSLWLSRTVPVEPGLRFQILDREDEGLTVSAVVRPWSD